MRDDHGPTRNLSPVGSGTPPSGSIVTAIPTGCGMSAGVSTIVVTRPLASGLNSPALIGAGWLVRTHNWYVLPTGSAGRLDAVKTNPRERLQNARPPDRGAADCPDRSIRCRSGAARTAIWNCP